MIPYYDTGIIKKRGGEQIATLFTASHSHNKFQGYVMPKNDNSPVAKLSEECSESTKELLAIRFIDFMRWSLRERQDFVMTNFGESPAFVQSGLLKAVH